ncbi:MAG: cryptochrome/photolyase family protein [Myxococcales bacterium]|nr:cryptochrome/photolyase family protein [Myxococcales bacterium]
MELFLSRLAAYREREGSQRRRWLFVPYDQLSDQMGPLSREEPQSMGIVLVETLWKAARRPYHKQKLALILSNMRHFALEQAARGVAVRYLMGKAPYPTMLEAAMAEDAALRGDALEVMEPAERELRVALQPLVDAGKLRILPHEGWLSSSQQFRESLSSEGRYRMDAFYRRVRRDTGYLMERGKPLGGKFSFDTENRKPWHGEPPAPELPVFLVDPITQEVGDFLLTKLAHHPGTLDLTALPQRREDAETLWTWAKARCLPMFGPYEDAMSMSSTNLFHTRLSSLINIHRLLPKRILEEVLDLSLPLASKEGFVRQILGWREFVRHVHRETDGFRRLPHMERPLCANVPGDGGYAGWSGKDWRRRDAMNDPDGGAIPAFLSEGRPIPPAFWGKASGLACLDQVVSSVWEEGYSHHITRLMVLSNLATLLDVSPRALTDWFWVAYTDAYDWVVEPNVLGMGTYAVGDLMTTKPYVSGTPYLQKMSDYCKACRFDPKKDCPISSLYWAFLARHQEKLSENIRLKMPMASLRKRSDEKKQQDAALFAKISEQLAMGEVLSL